MRVWNEKQIEAQKKGLSLVCFTACLLCVPFAAMGLLHPVLVAFTLAMSFFSILTNSLLLYFWLPQDNRD